MKPIIYYYPERLWDMAINHAKGWGRSYENRTYKTENGDAPCIDVKDSEGNTLYLLIIDDALYLNSGRAERLTFELRYLLTHDAGERIIMAQTRADAIKQGIVWCNESGNIFYSIHQLR
jgi:hypothetical protein